MLLILRSRAASSLFWGSFGLPRFFSGGTLRARGCRWATGACGTVEGRLFAPCVPVLLGCAIAPGPAIRARSAIAAIDPVAVSFVVIHLRILLLPSAEKCITASEDRDARHRNNRRHDSAFPPPLHVAAKKNLPAPDKPARPATCRARRACRARIPAGKDRKPAPAGRASVPARG